jgi:hypothetical protein
MAISDGHGLPLAVHVASASPHETKLVEATLEERFFADLPERLIGDRAYDSDRLDERLMQHYGIEMIAPTHFHSHQNPHPRRSHAAALSPSMESRTLVCLVA